MQNLKFDNCEKESALREDKILLAWFGKNLIALSFLSCSPVAMQHSCSFRKSTPSSLTLVLGGLRVVRKPARFYSES